MKNRCYDCGANYPTGGYHNCQNELSGNPVQLPSAAKGKKLSNKLSRREQIRIAALNAAIYSYGDIAKTKGNRELMEIARDFENYIRTGKVV